MKISSTDALRAIHISKRGLKTASPAQTPTAHAGNLRSARIAAGKAGIVLFHV